MPVKEKTKPEHSIVGKSARRVDALDKVLGEAAFVDDMAFPGMLFGKIVTSPLPHALIRKISFDRALALEGVVAAVGADAVPGNNWIDLILNDQPVIVGDKARYRGDCVALVAAVTQEGAEEAALAVEIDYEELPGAYTAEESLAEGAPLIHARGNVLTHLKVRKGDTDKVLPGCEVVISETLRTGRQEHAYLETLGVIVVPGRNDAYTVYGSMQCPFYVQRAVACALGIGLNRVRVVQTITGGAFGGKEDTPSEIYSRAAVLACRTRRPVKMVLSREEDFLITSKRHPEVIKYTLGARRDGTLEAARVEIYGDAGAYATLSPVVMFRSTIHAAGPYRIPNVKVDTYGVYTNNPPSGAFRGFGAPQVCFACESMIDQMAGELGMDPLELRLKNALEQGDETATGQVLIHPVSLKETMHQAAREIGYPGKANGQGTSAYPKVRGMGIASVHYGCSLGSKGWYADAAGAYMQICQDGTVTVAIGNTEIGQGAFTVLSQIAAEGLGVPLEQIQILEVDTGMVPDSGPTVASRATVFSGNAILNAIAKLKEQIAPVACQLLGCEPQHLIFKHGRVSDARRLSSGLEFNKLMRECYRQNMNLAAEGWFVAPKLKFDEETGLGEAYYDYSYGTNIAEVEVDLATGLVKVLRVVAAYDVGTPINVNAIEGQVEGGITQAMGWALYEDFVMDKGRILTPELTAYTAPQSLDIPEIKTVLVEGYSPPGPFGAKSVGEPSIIPGAAAIANAVSAACGVRITELPIRPERLLELVRTP